MSNLVEYKEYLTKIESAKDKMKLITRNSERNPAYEAALNLIRTNAEQSRTICKRDVQEALVIPMERLCRYPIFMERLIKESGPEHSDYDNLKIVHDLLKEINSYVNACSGDNTGIIERERIYRRTGVQTLEFGFPMRTKDKTQFKEGLAADKVSKDGEKINWERIEVFVFHKALILTGKDSKANKFQIRVIKFEHILATTGKVGDFESANRHFWIGFVKFSDRQNKGNRQNRELENREFGRLANREIRKIGKNRGIRRIGEAEKSSKSGIRKSGNRLIEQS